MSMPNLAFAHSTRDVVYNGKLYPEPVNSVRDVLLQAPQTRERRSLDFSNTLSDFAEALKRLYELQQLTSYWKDIHDRLYNDYRKAMVNNSQMSMEIRKRDDMIVQLQAEIRELQAAAAPTPITVAQQGEGEFASPPSAFLSHWISSRSEPVDQQEETDLDDLSLATM
ncbi:uncharacterized protein B0T15DRAFT_511046 [Chaetomium strumarium]|uniref:Uncharacterized protein n=1 Tax=Chaetomium strumarium TaxID=1170767 RepID=A0AAJ0GS06_9PEZI|nr:hypothetical protein B0T15DRAFT_511046 [Chaetomium strumarium]